MKSKVKKESIKTFKGKVVSDKMEKTVVVEITTVKPHPMYRKIIKKDSKLYAQDDFGAKIGDTVLIKECKPISKTKRFRVIEILKEEK